jgi:two-component system cell cycle sensor histidine kinase/response regulator CckA
MREKFSLIDERARLDALKQYNIMDTPSEGGFDDITWLAADICRTPISVVTLIDERRQWFKSCRGLDIRETARELAFCAHTIQGRDVFEIENAIDDPEFRDNPLVVDPPKLRFYAGAPIITEEGYALGSVAVSDLVPRKLTDDQKHGLEALARQALAQLELRRALARSNKATERSVSLLKATLESTADGILVVDRSGKFAAWNNKFREMWDLPEEVLDSRDDWRALQHVVDRLKDPGSFLEKVSRLYSEPETSSFDVIYFKDGREIERYSQPQRLDDEIMGRVFSFRDVTGRKHLETQLRQAQKMEAIGRLAGGIAHDFNNLLHVIIGYTSLVQSGLSPGTESSNYSEQVMKAAERAAGLTRQLLAFSRKQPVQQEIFDINEAVRNFEKMLQRVIGEDVQLEIATSPGQNCVLADRAQLEQVILNLVVNSRDAMPEGGRLTIETEKLTVPAGQSEPSELAPGSYAVVSVTDSGSGMSENVQAHLFEPFFTTKEPGKGTGLGLALVYGIVRQASGNITVESTPGQGTKMTIYLPSAERITNADIAQAIPIRAPLSGKEVVLLVEDEESVRELLTGVLQSLGYQVIVASEGEEALRKFTEHPGRIDAVVTDLVMPGMRGTHLIRKLRDLDPNIPVVLMSGYSGQDNELNGIRDLVVLNKPFSPLVLASMLRDLFRKSA